LAVPIFTSRVPAWFTSDQARAARLPEYVVMVHPRLLFRDAGR